MHVCAVGGGRVSKTQGEAGSLQLILIIIVILAKVATTSYPELRRSVSAVKGEQMYRLLRLSEIASNVVFVEATIAKQYQKRCGSLAPWMPLCAGDLLKLGRAAIVVEGADFVSLDRDDWRARGEGSGPREDDDDERARL